MFRPSLKYRINEYSFTWFGVFSYTNQFSDTNWVSNNSIDTVYLELQSDTSLRTPYHKMASNSDKRVGQHGLLSPLDHKFGVLTSLLQVQFIRTVHEAQEDTYAYWFTIYNNKLGSSTAKLKRCIGKIWWWGGNRGRAGSWYRAFMTSGHTTLLAPLCVHQPRGSSDLIVQEFQSLAPSPHTSLSWKSVDRAETSDPLVIYSFWDSPIQKLFRGTPLCHFISINLGPKESLYEQQDTPTIHKKF